MFPFPNVWSLFKLHQAKETKKDRNGKEQGKTKNNLKDLSIQKYYHWNRGKWISLLPAAASDYQH
jgi:hypothetical protein